VTVDAALAALTAGLERDAELAQAVPRPDWDANFEGAVWDSDGWVADVGGDLNEHVARQDPARVLRQVEAHRRILARHAPIEQPSGFPVRGFTGPYCGGCGSKGNGFGFTPWPCPDVQDLAAIYEETP
jgi:hypothetical protein